MKVIGQFKEIYGEGFPEISTLISEKPVMNKDKILRYLKSGKHTSESPSRIRDVISGERIETNLFMQTDGEYVWRSDISYYFEKYNVKMPDDFINHILNMPQ